jgi:hypothetical protein
MYLIYTPSLCTPSTISPSPLPDATTKSCHHTPHNVSRPHMHSQAVLCLAAFLFQQVLLEVCPTESIIDYLQSNPIMMIQSLQYSICQARVRLGYEKIYNIIRVIVRTARREEGYQHQFIRCSKTINNQIVPC